MTTLFVNTFESPVGTLTLVAGDEGLHAIEFPENRHQVKGREQWQSGSHRVLDATMQQLSDYFYGKRRAFDLPLAPRGTAFQLQVWSALRDIPYGATCSYLDIARSIGKSSATRAVGAANGRNPLPIVVPCHRVIGANGALTGFGGGLPTKVFLLNLESSDRSSDAFRLE